MTAKSRRWIDATQTAAKTCTHPMPWQRGSRRAEMIARRQAALHPTARRAMGG